MNQLNENEDDNVQHEDLLINFYDQRCWNKIDQNIRDFLVESGPKRAHRVLFPKDSTSRHFELSQYK